MTVCRTLAVMALFASVPLHQAGAQFGGMPGLPGSQPPVGAPGFGAPQGPPPICQQLLALKSETEKHGSDIAAANKRKASAQEACRLFKVYIASEAKLIRGIEQNLSTCGIPSEIPTQMKAGHTRANQVAKEVCDAAAQGPRPSGPSLSDALNTTPFTPLESNPNKRGGGAFDTMSGNVLSR